MRFDVPRLIDLTRRDLAADDNAPAIRIVDAPPGCGKSTILLRVALELSRLKIPVFFFSGEERLSTIATAACLDHMTERPVLIVDAIGDHADQVAQLAERLLGTGTKLVLLGADRQYDASNAMFKLAEMSPSRFRLAGILPNEALALIEKMRSEGLLGRRFREPDSVLAARIRKTDLIVALCEVAANLRRFDDVTQSIWDDVSEGPARRLLGAVALAYSHNLPLKFSIAQRVCGESVAWMMQQIAQGELQGIVVRGRYMGEYLSLRHRVLAERLLTVAVPSAFLFDCYVDLVNALAPYVSRSTIRARTTEARLAARFLDFEPHVIEKLGAKAREFYIRIRDKWSWNSRYWEQVALLELKDRNYELAIAHAEQAVGIEQHPLTYSTLGYVLISAAENAADERQAKRLLDEGIEALKRGLERSEEYIRDVHAYHIAINGTIRYFERWAGPVDSSLQAWIRGLLAFAKDNFAEGHKGFNWTALEAKWQSLSGSA